MLKRQAWDLGWRAESYHHHIVIKLKISKRSLARVVTAAVRAIIIGSENMCNCLQLAPPLQLTWQRHQRHSSTMAVVIEIWQDYITAWR